MLAWVLNTPLLLIMTLQTREILFDRRYDELCSFIRGSLEWTFSKFSLSDASLWNQYKFIAFNIFSCIILIIYRNILIITVVSNETTN